MSVDLIGIGASGVSAYRNALAAVGDNIVNAETPGYSRRQVRLTEAGTSTGIDPYYRDKAGFGGVDTAQVQRAWDDFRAADARLALSADGRADARVRWLGATETALGDGDAGVGAQLTAFFNAGDALAADPANKLARGAMIARLGDTAGAIRTGAEDLARNATGIASEAATTVDSINATLAQLAKINLGLRRATEGTAAHAQIADERDRLIDDLSSKLDVDTQLGGDGTVTVTLGSTTLLAPGKANALALHQANDGRLTLSTDVASTPTLIYPAGGSIAGLIEMSANVADRRGALNALASDFTASVNQWSAQGVDLTGAAGTAMLSIGAGGAASLAVVIADPDKIAAATGTSANGNLLTLGALRGSNGAEARWSGLVTGNAQALAAAKSEGTATAARKDASLAARDEVTGIDLDTEAGELIRFQQAYSGSAKIIQVARETLQSILDLF